MRVLALITARGGSKRIPDKNVRVLGGRPLIAWSIDVVKGIPEVCDILVSTDSANIAGIARAAGALVPWLRPAELATDAASSVDVCLHALDWYERELGAVDGLMLLQPTSPFRSRETVLKGLESFRLHRFRSVLAVSPAPSHPLWCFHVEGETMRPFVAGDVSELRSQDLPPAYVINGALYVIAPGDIRSRRSFCSRETIPLIIDDPVEGIDIDTDWDWKVAEAALGTRMNSPNQR